MKLVLFRKLYAPTKPDQPLEKIKSSHPCCLSPCKTVLEQKLRRTNYVARIWRNARLAQPVEFGPDGHGWRVVNSMTSCSLFGLRVHKTHPLSVLTVLTRMMGTLRTMTISRVVIFPLMNQTKVMKTRQWQYKMNVISNCVSSFEHLLTQLNPCTNGGYG